MIWPLVNRVYLVALGIVVVFAFTAWGTPVAPLDALIAIVLVFGPWAFGGTLGWLWGRTWHRLLGVIVIGAFMTAGGFGAFLFFAGSSQEAACGEDDCFRYFGHWIEASLAIQWPIYAVVAWSLSAVVLARRRSLDLARLR